MDFLKDETAKKIGYGIALVFIILGFISIFLNIKINKERNKEVVTVERVTGNYKLLSYEKKNGFKITVKEVDSGKVYDNSFVSADCVLAQERAKPGKDLVLTRFTNINLSDDSVSFFFKGAYEQLCTNLSYNPEKGNNYFKM